MAKTLKQIFTKEEKIPLPNDETNKKVKAKHPVKKTKDANGNDDKLFNASGQKPSKTNANKDAVSEAVGISNDERKEYLKAKKDGKSYKPSVDTDDSSNVDNSVRANSEKAGKLSRDKPTVAKQTRSNKMAHGKEIAHDPKRNAALKQARSDRKDSESKQYEISKKRALDKADYKGEKRKQWAAGTRVRGESFTTEAVGATMKDREAALLRAKRDKEKGRDADRPTVGTYTDAKHQTEHGTLSNRSNKKTGIHGTPGAKKVFRGLKKLDDSKLSKRSKNMTNLTNLAKKIVNKEEVEHIEEGYTEQKAAYMASAVKKANQICNMISKLANCKTDYGEPYYYDSKYLYRQLEDMYDNLESQYDSYKKSKQNKLTKAY